ncbi:MAG TPA: iron-sulfur cluster assembly accessory protein [Rickettsiales bacterium]|nr:iron-sulfur cluster assembly accessory protein [Rickettsiales bacterium]
MQTQATESFTVTDAAAARIAAIMSKEPEGTHFRISVQGGGCSGFQYKFDFDGKPIGQTDIVIEKNGAQVIIDDLSIGFINGSTLDYIETLGSSEFEIRNPNATAKCGCGNSFAV